MTRNDDDGSTGLVEMIRGRNGLGALLLRSGAAEAEVYRHGAHLTRYAPGDRREVLWVSDHSAWGGDQPIRGGVPVCFPWFGAKEDDEEAPSHGFARLREWEVDSVGQESGQTSVTLTLADDEDSRAMWDHRFELRMSVCLSDHLKMTLEVRNVDEKPMTFTEALHTYLAVSDVRQVSISGLGQVEYIDKLTGRREKQDDAAIRFTGETDRIYVNTEDDCVLDDPAWGRRIVVRKENSRSTVVWNPWVDKSGRMEDFGDEEWPGMVCIETANAADNAVTLEPGQTWPMSVGISVEQR
jgi:glucose-6-phosphate 1-epimerase